MTSCEFRTSMARRNSLMTSCGFRTFMARRNFMLIDNFDETWKLHVSVKL